MMDGIAAYGGSHGRPNKFSMCLCVHTACEESYIE